MSLVAEKRREYVAIAEKALGEKKFAKASQQFAMAGLFTLKLAEQSEGKVMTCYVSEALALEELATALFEKARQGPPSETNEQVKEKTDTQVCSSGAWRVVIKPSERLADVVGLLEVKRELREKVIEPFLHPQLKERFKVKTGGGVLMYGPPGNGKTYIAKAVAGELDAAFFNVKTSDIKSKYVGESEKNLQRLFEEARAQERAIIFLDEADNLLSRIGNQKIGVVNQFLTLLDGFESNHGKIMVLAATNRPEMIDLAVLRSGRLGTLVYVGPPDKDARRAILDLHLRGAPLDKTIPYEEIVNKTEGYSGADIAEVCNVMKMSAMNRQLQSGVEERIVATDAAAALDRIRPSITAEQVAYYAGWREQQKLEQ